MTGAMLEVLSALPERLARKIVQINAGTAIEELCIGQIQMSAQYRGKMIPLTAISPIAKVRVMSVDPSR